MDDNIRNTNIGIYNTGNYNSGDCNTGNYNSGYWNTGNYNSGIFNAGCFSTGDVNTGEFNVGDFNTGDGNTGSLNTGNFNTGSYNTGSWNTSDYNTGYFNTVEPKMMLFNKLSDITHKEWIFSEAYQLLATMPTCISWICEDAMTEKEKEKHPSYKTIGGYLKKLNQKELHTQRQKWYDGLSKKDKELILSIPNFDAEIFKECTGINIRQEEEK